MSSISDRLSRAAAEISAIRLDDGRWAYFADETRRYNVVDEDDVAKLYDYLVDVDPAIRRDAYSHWCAGTRTLEMPAGWTPGCKSATVEMRLAEVEYADANSEEPSMGWRNGTVTVRLGDHSSTHEAGGGWILSPAAARQANDSAGLQPESHPDIVWPGASSAGDLVPYDLSDAGEVAAVAAAIGFSLEETMCLLAELTQAAADTGHAKRTVRFPGDTPVTPDEKSVANSYSVADALDAASSAISRELDVGALVEMDDDAGVYVHRGAMPAVQIELLLLAQHAISAELRALRETGRFSDDPARWRSVVGVAWEYAVVRAESGPERDARKAALRGVMHG